MKLISMFTFPLMWIAAVPVIVAAQVGNATTASSTMYDSKAEAVTHNSDEFACAEGISVSHGVLCDGYDDCGNMADESDCKPECPTSDQILNCFTHVKMLTDSENTWELNYALDETEDFYFVRFDVNGNISTDWLRFNITKNTSPVLLKWNPRNRSHFISLKSPLLLKPGDWFTISVEATDGMLGWRPTNVTFEEIHGIRLIPSCRHTTDCFRSFNNASFVFERDCTLSILERFLREQYKYCIDICENDTLTDPIAGILTFPTTNIGQTANSTEICESSSTRGGKPRATRYCFGDKKIPGAWKDPVLSCYDDKIINDNTADVYESVKDITLSENNVEVFSLLLATTTNTTDINTDDLETVTSLLEKLTSVNRTTTEVTNNVVEIVDNLLNLRDHTNSESEYSDVPSRILQCLERQLTNLHQGETEVNFTSVRPNLLAMAVSVDNDFFTTNLTFGNFFTSKEKNIAERLTDSLTNVYKGESVNKSVKASITLPKFLLNETENNESGKLPLTFIVYRTSQLFVYKGTQENSAAIESLVVSATVEGKTIGNLVNPVVTRFYLPPVENNCDDTRRCVFWNVSLANGSGAWSSQGCELISLTESEDPSVVKCSCNHLTNFAILVDIQEDINNGVLDVLVIVGCVVSIISLSITIVTFLANRKLRAKQPQQILINLCFALLGLYFSFLIGINRTSNKAVCVIFGALIHFLCLSSVAWMSVEATNMYFMFIKVFKSGTNNFMIRASLTAWGIPLVFVVVLVSANHSSYYNCKYCFPSAGSIAFYIGILATIPLMLIYNMVMFILVIKSLTCRRQFSKDNSRKETIKRIQNAASISVLLGLSWSFGFLAIGGAQLIFNLIFLILNSLQGFFIILLFCVRSTEVRSQWSKVTVSWKMPYTRSVSSQKSHTTDSSGVVLTGTKKVKEIPHDSSKENCPENSQSQTSTAL